MGGQCYNFDAYSHQDLFSMINNHDTATACMASAPSTAGTQAVWQEFAQLMASAQDRVQRALAKAGAEWVGGAADQMNSGVAPMGVWAGDTHAAGADTHGSVVMQSSAYSSAQRSMPAPKQVTSTANSDFVGIPGGVTHLFGGQTDQDQQEADAKAAKAQAVTVMNNYQSGSSAATSSVGTFTAPPAIAGSIGTAPASTGQVGGYGGSPNSMNSGYGNTGGGYGSGGAYSGAHDSMNGGGVGFNPIPGGGPQPGNGAQPTPGHQPQVGFPGAPGSAGASSASGPWGGGIGESALFGGAFAGGLAGGIGSGLGRGGSSTTSTNGLGAEEEEGFGKGGASEADGEGRSARNGGIIGEEEENFRRNGSAAAGAKGAAGANGAMAGGAGAKKEEDKEHKSADYLEELDDVWTGGETVAPSVIGE